MITLWHYTLDPLDYLSIADQVLWLSAGGCDQVTWPTVILTITYLLSISHKVRRTVYGDNRYWLRWALSTTYYYLGSCSLWLLRYLIVAVSSWHRATKGSGLRFLRSARFPKEKQEDDHWWIITTQWHCDAKVKLQELLLLASMPSENMVSINM